MGVALISWGRFYDASGNRITVPAPSSDVNAPWLWDFLAKEAPALRAAGFSALQLPPASKAQGGSAAGSDGYGLFDPRDLGNKPQQGSVPTRYGSAQSLRRLVACSHAVGMDVYLDLVLHQLSGENGGSGVFKYLGSDGKTLNGRGAMQSGCFRGVPPANRPQDAVPVPGDDFEFGREKVYQNCQPAGYTINDAIDYGDWLFRTTDADGMRYDDTKGAWAPFVSQFMRSKTMAGKFAYSEYFDGNPGNLNWWATSYPMSSRSLVEDFTLHFALQEACNNGNALALEGAGYTAMNPFMSCTFVDNPDTDTSQGEQVVLSKLLAYAFLLSIEGYPFVYAKDYYPSSVWPGAYGLKPFIDNLVWIHETLATGGTATQWSDSSVMVVNRTGEPGLLTAMNFDTWNQRQITCYTSFGSNAHLHDYTGRHGDIWTDWEGRATFTLPSNAYQGGQSYLCFSRAGIGTPIPIITRPTTQTFFGAADLDIPPAGNSPVEAGKIWCAKGSEINLHLTTGHPLSAGSHLTFEVFDNANTRIGGITSPADRLSVPAATTGWHSLRISGKGLPAEGVPFELTATYTGTKGLD